MSILESLALPEWLSRLDEKRFNTAFPHVYVLQGSLYYPSSGFDGVPVQRLGNSIHSFVHVDYGYTLPELQEKVAQNGFKGYTPIFQRPVSLTELLPKGKSLSQVAEEAQRVVRPKSRRMPPNGWVKPPFAYWYIFEREQDMPESHGPLRFSFLHLCAEGTAAYFGLYNVHGFCPRALAIIQPGTGYGGNWTDFRDEKDVLGRVVLANKAGIPEILLYGGMGLDYSMHHSCWSNYPVFGGWLVHCEQVTVGLWRKEI